MIRKNTVKASRSGDVKFNPFSLNSHKDEGQSENRISGESGSSYRSESVTSSQENEYKEKFINKKKYEV